MARVPIIRFGEILVATVQEDLYDRDVLDLQDTLTAQLERTGARGVLIGDLATIPLTHICTIDGKRPTLWLPGATGRPSAPCEGCHAEPPAPPGGAH